MVLCALATIKRTTQCLLQCLWVFVCVPVLLVREVREERGSVYEGFSLCILIFLVLPGCVGLIMFIMHPRQFLVGLLNG